MMIYAFMADGCEEIEALAVVDLLRRADLDVKMVSIHNKEITEGSHGIGIRNDMMLDDIMVDADDVLFLPGGGLGTVNMKACEAVCTLLKRHFAAGGRIAAICAAPSVLGVLGLLKGKHATCYPGFESQLEGAVFCTEPVVTDGMITTSRGMGTSINLGLELIAILLGKEKADQIAASIMLPGYVNT